MTNVQSIVTPVVSNGHAPVIVSKAKGKAKAKATTPGMSAIEAVQAAFDYGSSMAGLDGNLTRALKAFKNDETVMADMLTALNVGYVMRKLSVDKDSATETVGKLKYNEKKNDDHHRTFEEQRVIDSVRVLWHRAKKMAGIIEVKPEAQVKAESARAEKEAHESRLIKADELVNPPEDVDIFEALTRLVSTMKSLSNKHSAKLVGDKGSAWRDWLASAPK